MVRDLATATYWNSIYDWRKRRIGKISESLLFWRLGRQVAPLLDEIGKPKGDILEIGCAPGSMLQIIHNIRPQHGLHGIDYSKDGIETARAKLLDAGIEATLHFGDLRTADPAEPYDLVASFGLIEHYDAPVEIVRHHARLCKPGGRVLVTVPNYTPRIVQRLSRRFDPQGFDTHNLDIMTADALRSTLSAAGLVDVRTGAGGAAWLRCIAAPGVRFGRTYERIGGLWNTLATFLPARTLWPAFLWASGQVPPAAHPTSLQTRQP